ncbi:MAG: hypothetical protein FWF84_07145, partial [Kiritimatiellaeota bacterium]|nr:hypothetical protein [Kiritimatiellota bacterium]
IHCKTFRAGENAAITANGGDASMTYNGGAGGGGRVAVWYRNLDVPPDFDILNITVDGGIGRTPEQHTGAEGTVVFAKIQPEGTLLLVR